ncbi:MAG: hypothetical protein EZS28_023572 [Streblomastix strix]|uniref:Uncharacterized protein n=1 Tax=Streblomastix strix TaxID=222440 RepID=A0A5J4VEP4_9EUKA|nr:MAG: hypothetical protein EZS28_023572 [Streblomastix strix]
MGASLLSLWGKGQKNRNEGVQGAQTILFNEAEGIPSLNDTWGYVFIPNKYEKDVELSMAQNLLKEEEDAILMVYGMTGLVLVEVKRDQVVLMSQQQQFVIELYFRIIPKNQQAPLEVNQSTIQIMMAAVSMNLVCLVLKPNCYDIDLDNEQIIAERIGVKSIVGGIYTGQKVGINSSDCCTGEGDFTFDCFGQVQTYYRD